MIIVLTFIAFAAGFYLGVFMMCLLAIGKKRQATKAIVLDAAA
jgi:hypothetical protein